MEPWDRFLTRLPNGYKRTGDSKWMARCPAHDDKNPSLSVKIAGDGKLLLHCFAGCSTEDVIAAVGLEWEELWPDDPHHRCGRAIPPRSGYRPAPRVDPQEIENAALRASQEPRALGWVAADEWMGSLALPDWLIPGYIERGSLNVVIGGWGSGKSALELDRCLHIAHGLSWQGLEPQEPQLVVYVCGEGQRGFQRRIAAWHQHHGLKPTRNLVIIPEAVLIGQPDHEEALQAALRQIQERYNMPIAMVVLDTMARCFGLKDESSNSDVAAWVNLIQAHIIAPTGAAVVVLHHPGHSAKERGRGASALPGAADTEWLVERSGDVVMMRCIKNKDAAAPEPVGWKILGVEIVIDGVGISAPVADMFHVEQVTVKGVNGDLARLLASMYRDAEELLEDQGRGKHEARIDRKSLEIRAAECGLVTSKAGFRKSLQRAVDAGCIVKEGVFLFPRLDEIQF